MAQQKQQKTKTRSQAVARIADRTASHHILYPIGQFLLWSFGTKPLSLTVSKLMNVVCNAWLTWLWF